MFELSRPLTLVGHSNASLKEWFWTQSGFELCTVGAVIVTAMAATSCLRTSSFCWIKFPTWRSERSNFEVLKRKFESNSSKVESICCVSLCLPHLPIFYLSSLLLSSTLSDLLQEVNIRPEARKAHHLIYFTVSYLLAILPSGSAAVRCAFVVQVIAVVVALNNKSQTRNFKRAKEIKLDESPWPALAKIALGLEAR